MEIVLLDTGIASLLHPRKRHSAEYQLYLPYMAGKIHAISFQTVAELLLWPAANNWGHARRTELDVVLKDLLVLPYDRQLAESWASISYAAQQAGRRLEAGDAWVAATAVYYGMRLLTHDRDLASPQLVGLDVVCLAS